MMALGKLWKTKILTWILLWGQLSPFFLMDSILEGSRMSKKEYTAIQVSLVQPVPALQLKLTSDFKEYVQCIGQHELQEDISAKVFVYRVIVDTQ